MIVNPRIQKAETVGNMSKVRYSLRTRKAVTIDGII